MANPIQVPDAVRTMAAHAGMSLYDVSAGVGKSKSWAGMVAGREGIAAATLARIADACGCALAIVDRETGETVATIEPPRD